MGRVTGCYKIFRIYDITAAQEAAGTCTDKRNFSNLALLFQEDIPYKKYGTLEENQFVLDGQHESFPDAPEEENFGLWSETMSGENRLFARFPVLDISFSGRHSSVGITLYFDTNDGDLCDLIRVKWYGGETLLSEKTFEPDDSFFFCENRVRNYTRIVITFTRTLRPYRYLKLQRIDFGLNLPLDGSNIITSTLLEEVDPLSSEIRINTLNFQMYDKQARFNLVNPQGYYDFLQRKQRVDVHETINEESFYMGSFYLDEPSADTEYITTMSCVDMAGIADQTDFYGGIYKNKLVSELLSEIAASAGAGVFFDLDAHFDHTTVSGHIPICTHREALQQIAFAIGAIVDCSRSRAIKVKPADRESKKFIGKDQNVDDHKILQTELVTGVSVTAHEYVAGDDNTELLNGFLDVGEHTIAFSEPVHSLTVTGAAISESGANYAILNVTVSGTVLLTGKRYNDNLRVMTAKLEDIPDSERANELRIEDATLVDASRAQEVAERILAYYQNRLEETGTVLLTSKEKAGAMVEIATMSEQVLKGMVESLDVDLVGGFLASAKIRGVVKK